MSLLTSSTPFLTYVPLNAEYDRVSKALCKSIGREDVCISVLLKVNNPALVSAFEARKAAITEKRGIAPDVVDVYHGTTMGAAERIAEMGFDKAFNTTSAFGRGTYASPFVKTALNYCKDVTSKEDFSMVFQAKFLKGRYGTHDPATKLIDPEKYDHSGNHYDILVTPHNDGILPEYLICYYTFA